MLIFQLSFATSSSSAPIAPSLDFCLDKPAFSLLQVICSSLVTFLHLITNLFSIGPVSLDVLQPVPPRTHRPSAIGQIASRITRSTCVRFRSAPQIFSKLPQILRQLPRPLSGYPGQGGCPQDP